MSFTTTLAPSATKRRAMPSPNPEPAPVMIATLFCKRMASSLNGTQHHRRLAGAVLRSAPMKKISLLLPLALAVVIWAILVAAGLALRPTLPVDETRYLAVAWEMWTGGNYLVPHLNGIPYHHKPPLLFWLITLGWHVFGVSETWGRLVAPLFALGCLLLSARLAQCL